MSQTVFCLPKKYLKKSTCRHKMKRHVVFNPEERVRLTANICQRCFLIEMLEYRPLRHPHGREGEGGHDAT